MDIVSGLIWKGRDAGNRDEMTFLHGADIRTSI